MIFEIDEMLVSTEILEQSFICDLQACKGACCLEGDEGAPIAPEEIFVLRDELPAIVPYMTPGAQAYLRENKEKIAYALGDEWAVEMMPEGACIFAFWNADNQVSCAIQAAFSEGKTSLQKPISCHLYPIRVNNIAGKKALSYHRWKICSAACKLGNKHQVKVYQFLRVPLIRAFGQQFFDTLCEVDSELNQKTE